MVFLPCDMRCKNSEIERTRVDPCYTISCLHFGRYTAGVAPAPRAAEACQASTVACRVRMPGGYTAGRKLYE